MLETYIVENLSSARGFLRSNTSKVIITNSEGSIHYYGIRVVYYILQTLKNEFPEKVARIVFRGDGTNLSTIGIGKITQRKKLHDKKATSYNYLSVIE